MHAVEHIQEDLGRLRRRRIIALAAYIGVVGVLLGVLLLRSSKETALERNTTWMVALGVLYACSTLGAAAAIGVPLFKKRALQAVGGVAILGIMGALFSVTRFDVGAILAVKLGLPCFMYGTALSAAAMVALGVLSGRLWRRFPDPGLILAIGVSAVGIAALHVKCGRADPLHLFGFHLTPLVVIYGIARVATRAREHLLREE